MRWWAQRVAVFPWSSRLPTLAPAGGDHEENPSRRRLRRDLRQEFKERARFSWCIDVRPDLAATSCAARLPEQLGPKRRPDGGRDTLTISADRLPHWLLSLNELTSQVGRKVHAMTNYFPKRKQLRPPQPHRLDSCGSKPDSHFRPWKKRREEAVMDVPSHYRNGCLYLQHPKPADPVSASEP